MSPNLLDRFPVEIVSHIFNLCLEPPEACDDWTPADKVAPFVLSSVCRSWRSVTQNTPQLWNTIFISFNSPEKVALHAQLTREWLARSKQVPLSVIVELDTDLFYLKNNIFIPLLDVVAQSAARWVSLDIRPDIASHLGKTPLALSLFLDSIMSPSLQRFSCDFGDWELPTGSLLSFFTRSSCPLREFRAERFDNRNNGFIRVLSVVPSLQQLAVIHPTVEYHRPTITDQFLSTFDSKKTGANKSGAFLPCLRTFAYEGRLNFAWDRLANFADHLQSNWTANDSSSKLQSTMTTPPSIRIHIAGFLNKPISCWPSDDSLPSFLHLLDSGFDIKISSAEFRGDKGWVEVDLLKSHPKSSC
ncbi:hypothetical protein CPB84DRAFT_1848618 [Gymnopilus junonius]|uniref:F-box domain-containing protein n=1 Tax=Gymnopilus junonius TaxID=109634 RepID=A0A9P5NHZ7_GYMJU|nr:hypothetical protein CPB84DRAFT_1848618 [Gymnopilus junonius]